MWNVNAEFKCRESKTYLRTKGILPQLEVLPAALPGGDLLLLPFSMGLPPCQESHTRQLMRVPSSCVILFSLILGSWIQPFSCWYLVSSSFLLLFHRFALPAG